MRNARVTTTNVNDIAKRATSKPPQATPAGGLGPIRASAISSSATTASNGAPPKALPSKRAPSNGPAGRTGAVAAAPNSHSVHQPKMSTNKLDPNRFANPFDTNTRKCKTSFSSSYVNGSIPCRLHTSASRYHLKWEAGAETGFSPDLLKVCADGLIETDHPYVVMAPMMFQELCLRSEGCLELFSPETVETVASHIRTALMASGSATATTAVKTASSGGGAGCGSGSSMFEGALGALSIFLQHTGNLMLPYLAKYIIPVLARPFQDRNKKDAVAEVLRLMETQCGPDATKIIKAKIPTY